MKRKLPRKHGILEDTKGKILFRSFVVIYFLTKQEPVLATGREWRYYGQRISPSCFKYCQT